MAKKGEARSEAGEILASGVAETRAEWADGEGVLPPAAAFRGLVLRLATRTGPARSGTVTIAAAAA